MVKTKVPSWEGKKKMFKDGDPDVFRGFNFQTWKNMTEGERAMWTEFSEVARAPIPKEVIDFKRKSGKVETANQQDAKEVVEITHVTEIPEEEGKVTTATYNDEEAEKTLIKAELEERGIKYSHNSKLETLQKKLADADNTE